MHSATLIIFLKKSVFSKVKKEPKITEDECKEFFKCFKHYINKNLEKSDTHKSDNK